MLKDYIKSFLIGSSFPVTFWFFVGASLMNNKKKNYLFEQYIFFAPISFGIMNMLSLYLSKKYLLSKRKRYLLISIISIALILSFVKIKKTYNFEKGEWMRYVLMIIIAHTLTYNITVFYIEKLLE